MSEKPDETKDANGKKPPVNVLRFPYSVPDVWTNEHYISYARGRMIGALIVDNEFIARFYGVVQLIKDQHVRFENEEFKALKDATPDQLRQVPMAVMGYLTGEIARQLENASAEYFREST